MRKLSTSAALSRSWLPFVFPHPSIKIVFDKLGTTLDICDEFIDENFEKRWLVVVHRECTCICTRRTFAIVSKTSLQCLLVTSTC